MWYHFTFDDGSNPYITKTNAETFRILRKYNCKQVGCCAFLVQSGSEWKPGNDYKSKKSDLQSIAIDWQHAFDQFNYSYGELLSWQGFFYELGARYGLLTEFHENGIC